MITFSKQKGLVEAGKDDGAIRRVHDMWFYMSIAGYFPLLHSVIVRVSRWLNIDLAKSFCKIQSRSDAQTKAKKSFRYK